MKKISSLLKTKATQLRNSGLSYNEIRSTIGVSKSTLSSWLKNIRLKPEYRKRLYTKQIEILSRGPKSQKERRIKEIEQIIKTAENEITHPISFEAFRFAGAALYWAEGSKGRMMEITNSDPDLILFIVRWIEKVFKISAKNLKARLNIYPQQSDLEIKKFWSEITNIPVENFGKSYVKPFSTGYRKNNLYYGTIRIEVPKSANMVHQVFGWTRGLLKDNSSKVLTVKKTWHHLIKTQRPVNLKIK